MLVDSETGFIKNFHIYKEERNHEYKSYSIEVVEFTLKS